jgi:hypothetical protein
MFGPAAFTLGFTPRFLDRKIFHYALARRRLEKLHQCVVENFGRVLRDAP